MRSSLDTEHHSSYDPSPVPHVRASECRQRATRACSRSLGSFQQPLDNSLAEPQVPYLVPLHRDDDSNLESSHTYYLQQTAANKTKYAGKQRPFSRLEPICETEPDFALPIPSRCTIHPDSAWTQLCTVVSIITGLICSVFNAAAHSGLKCHQLRNAAESVENFKLADRWIALRLCERAEEPVDRTTSIAAFVTIATADRQLLVKRENGGVIASLSLSELAAVPIGERMIALVDLPSIQGSPASRRVAMESAAILGLEDAITFHDIAHEFRILTSCPILWRAYIYLSFSWRRFFR